MRRGFPVVALMLAGALTVVTSVAQESAPARPDSSVIRSRGDAGVQAVMLALEAGFRKQHPERAFADTLEGSATGMAGIITSVSDLSVMGRAATLNEVMGFEWEFRVKPLGFQIMNGSLKTEGRSPALAVFVSPSNPMQSVSMAQLATLLGCPATGTEAVRWGQFGGGGSWANKRLHAYLSDDQTGTGAWLQQTIQGKRDCWNWEIVHEFKDVKGPGGTVVPAAQQIIAALQRDPAGIAVSTLAFADDRVKALPVNGVELSAATVMDGSYPLARRIYVYVNRAKDKPIDTKVAEFLQFTLSDQGQAIIAAQGDFLRLDAATAAAEAAKLK